MRSAAVFAFCCVIGSTTTHAAPIFFDDFNNYNSGGAATSQANTGLQVQAYGSLANFSASGANVVHAVDRSGTGDWAAMLYGGSGAGASDANQITTKVPVAANALGTSYTVAFQGAGATYSNIAQATKTGDYLEFIVQDAQGNIVSTHQYNTPAFTETSSNPFADASFIYVGDGNGEMTLEVLAVANAGDFGGAIDNLSISTTAVPEPVSASLLALGLVSLGFVRRPKMM